MDRLTEADEEVLTQLRGLVAAVRTLFDQSDIDADETTINFKAQPSGRLLASVSFATLLANAEKAIAARAALAASDPRGSGHEERGR